MNETTILNETLSEETTTEFIETTGVVITDEALIKPVNFLKNTSYMAEGMLTIFAVMLVIILLTNLLNKAFSRPKKLKVKKEKGKNEKQSSDGEK